MSGEQNQAVDDAQRLEQGTRLLGVALLVHLLLSFRLWAGERLFPHVPVWQNLALPGFVEYLVAAALVLLSAGLVVLPRDRRLALQLAIMLPAYCLFDQMRLQPWLYLFWLLLVARCGSQENPRIALGVQRLAIAGLYVWSGLHKLNPEYWNYTHGFVLQPLQVYLPAAVFQALLGGSYLAGPMEALLGLGLLFVRTRTLACRGLWLMHAFLLLCLGTQHWNAIVWPWNLVMMCFVWRYFYESDWKLDLKSLLTARPRLPTAAVLALVWLAPLLNLAGLWDHYLSFSLYSGRSRALVIYVKADVAERLDPKLQPLLSEFVNADGYRVVPADDWSLAELHVPVPPQRRIYAAVARHLCGWDLAAGDYKLLFAIYRRSGRGDEPVFTCDDCRNGFDASATR